GDCYAVGISDSSNFPQTPGTFQGQHGPAFVTLTKLRASDGSLIYSSRFGPTTNNFDVTGVAVDSAGRATVVGSTDGADFPTTPNAFDPVKNAPPNYSSGFVTRFSPSGDALVFSTFIEGPQTGGNVTAVA